MKNFRIKTTDETGNPTSFEVRARDAQQARNCMKSYQGYQILAVEEVLPGDMETEP